MENTIAVTGASGFIGKHLVGALVARGYRVRCLVREKSNVAALRSYGVELIYGDVTDVESVISVVKGTSQVFHLAGLTRELTAGDFMRVNRDGCANVVTGCLRSGQETGRMPILISLSSLAAAGPGIRATGTDEGAQVREHGKTFRLPYCLKTETMLPNPISPYGRSKLAGEREILLKADILPVSILRPPIIFGQGDMLALPLVRMAKRSWCFPIPGYFDQFYSFLHVSDLVEQMIGVSQSGQRAKQTSLDPIDHRTGPCGRCSGEGIYYPGRQELIRMSSFIRTFALAAGRKGIRMVYCPPLGVLGTGVVMETFRRLTHRQVPMDWNKAIEAIRGPWIVSAEKTRACLGVLPVRSLEEQIQETFQWYDEQRLLD